MSSTVLNTGDEFPIHLRKNKSTTTQDNKHTDRESSWLINPLSLKEMLRQFSKS